MDSALEAPPTFAALGWDELLEGVRLNVEWCAQRTVDRMRTLPSFAGLDDDALRPVVNRNYEATLAGLVLRRRPLPSDPKDSFVGTGAERARQGVAASDMAAAWRIGQDSLYLLASRLVEQGPHRDQLLREFLELVMSWVDFAMLAAAEGHRLMELSELRRLMQEQAALRRVATLVAREASAVEVLDKVAEEVGLLLGVELATIHRYDAGGIATVVARWGEVRREAFRVGYSWSPDPESITAIVRRTERPARIDLGQDPAASTPTGARRIGLPSAVGSPIVANGRLWGAITAGSSRPEPMPDDAESRIAQFTELVATAISNLEARAEVRRLAEEQAALRRVATLVAREASRAEVFEAIGKECAHLFGNHDMRIVRYEDGSQVVVASSGVSAELFPVGSRQPLGGENTASIVFRTGRPARLDNYATVSSGAIGEAVRAAGMQSVVATPIIVQGRLWGAMGIGARDALLPPDTESRLAQFSELMATAIANVQARSDLATSRARILAAGDEERRRVVRDLHDGAQQRLVHTVVTLKHARRALDRGQADASGLLDEALEHARRATDELRELAHGILPSALTLGGLDPGIRALASRMSIPVDVDVSVDRLPETVEATAYFIVAEALTNVTKHAHAQQATVDVHRVDGVLRVEVRDDGVGGADSDGHGLLGLRDRLAALEGTLQVESPAGGGTQITAFVPVLTSLPASAAG